MKALGKAIGLSLLVGCGMTVIGCAAGTLKINGSGGSTGSGSGGAGPAGGSGGTGATGGATNATGGTTASGGVTGGGGRAGTGSTGGTAGSTVGSTGGASVPRGTGGAGPIGITLPYREDFEDGVADGFVSGIDEEQAPLGTWAVVTDGATRVYREQSVTDDPSWAVGGAYQWTDQHLETRVKIVSGAADVLIAIAVRFTGFKSYYFLEIRNDAVKIRVRTPSTQVDLVSYSFGNAAALVDGTWYKFGLSAKGPALAVFFNDVQVAMVNDATLTAGGIAFGVRDGVVEFDDVTVTLPP